MVRDGIEHLLCCPLCEVHHENVKNFNHHSRSVHKVGKFSFKAVEGDEGAELAQTPPSLDEESDLMDVDLPVQVCVQSDSICF